MRSSVTVFERLLEVLKQNSEHIKLSTVKIPEIVVSSCKIKRKKLEPKLKGILMTLKSVFM